MSIAERPPVATTPAPAVRGNPGLYRVVWRWHFYAGVLVAPVLAVVAVTGGLYVFKSELEPVFYRQMFVEPGGDRVPLERQLAAATAAVPPGYAATRIEVSADPTKATAVLLLGKDLPFRRVYVDPHSATVQGEVGEDNFFRVVLDLHRRLWIGTTGRVIVELVTCWTIVLLLTGAYLWWPRKAEKVMGVVAPRLRAKRYVVLRDLHTVVGVAVVPVAVTIAATGLIYTYAWGSGYRYVAAQTGASLADPPASKSPATAPPLPLDEAVRVARGHFPDADGFSVVLPPKPGAALVMSASGSTGPTTRGSVALDRSTGEILRHTTLAQAPTLTWWRAWNYPLHVGSVLGTPTKVVWLLACVVLAGLPLTGLWMWWTRRPKAQVGLPRRPPARVPGWLLGLIAVLALVLPVVGLSLALILAGEWLAGVASRRRGPVPAAV